MAKKTQPVPAARGAAEAPQTMAAGSEEASAHKSYPGKQQDLYAYARLGWSNYQEFLSNFTAFSPSYTAQLATNQLAFIEATEALPDINARKVLPLEARVDLVDLNTAVLKKFSEGRIYIERTYTVPHKQAMMLNAAGQGYYEAATRKNWTSTMSLISAFKGFLANYGQELIDSNQMPVNFPPTFDTISDPFVTRWQDYKNTWESAGEEQQLKFDNNEEIYLLLSQMCEVGKLLAGTDMLMKKKFTISALLREVSGIHPAGVKGYFTIGGDRNLPLTNGRIWDGADPERFAEPDAAGKYQLRLPSGSYLLMAEAEGMQPLLIEKTINVGVMSRLTLAFQPATEAIASPAAEDGNVLAEDAVTEKAAVLANGNGLMHV